MSRYTFVKNSINNEIKKKHQQRNLLKHDVRKHKIAGDKFEYLYQYFNTMPVSYTHLDVYKRQLNHGVSGPTLDSFHIFALFR